VCDSADGDDGGTLLRELQFYTDSAAAHAHIEIYDPMLAKHRELLAAKGLGEGFAGRRLYMNVFPFDQDRDRDVPETFMTGIDVEVEELSIDGVLDLRRPQAANWLARTISRLAVETSPDEAFRCFPFRSDVDSFPELLPAVADQAKGGGNFHLITGLFLRHLGVSGLVFPSVRSDFYVLCTDGLPTRSHGWTFVDYRDAPLPRLAAFFELRPDWPGTLIVEGGDDGGRTVATYASEVEFVATRELSQGEGGFALRGVEQRLRAGFFANSLSALLCERWGDSRLADVHRVLELLATISSPEAATLGGMALFAALGMRAARQDLLAALEGPLGSTPEAGAFRDCCAALTGRGEGARPFLARWFGAMSKG
jgi:hypothetical protein